MLQVCAIHTFMNVSGQKVYRGIRYRSTSRRRARDSRAPRATFSLTPRNLKTSLSHTRTCMCYDLHYMSNMHDTTEKLVSSKSFGLYSGKTTGPVYAAILLLTFGIFCFATLCQYRRCYNFTQIYVWARNVTLMGCRSLHNQCETVRTRLSDLTRLRSHVLSWFAPLSHGAFGLLPEHIGEGPSPSIFCSWQYADQEVFALSGSFHFISLTVKLASLESKMTWDDWFQV